MTPVAPIIAVAAVALVTVVVVVVVVVVVLVLVLVLVLVFLLLLLLVLLLRRCCSLFVLSTVQPQQSLHICCRLFHMTDQLDPGMRILSLLINAKGWSTWLFFFGVIGVVVAAVVVGFFFPCFLVDSSG